MSTERAGYRQPIASAATEIGTRLPEISMRMSAERFEHWYGPDFSEMLKFIGMIDGSLPERGIHGDREAAEREGLPAPIAGGIDVASLIYRSLSLFFGRGWFEGGRATITIRRPIYAEDFCTAKGIVTARERDGAGARLTCEVWVENQAGERKIVGTVSGIV